ncbi:MAG: universal stress protein [Rhodospirillales bacterium]|nr:universal stress protein [Rhodospirillales bacterium]
MIKRLLVHLDNTSETDARIEAAVGLAARFNAVLVGFFAIGGLDRRGASTSNVETSPERILQARATASGISVEYYEVFANQYPEINNCFIVASRHCDLSIVGQRNENQAGRNVPENLVEQVITRSGRPVLVVPYAGRFPSLGRRAVIAWNGSREAARTVLDAVPILATAENVTVLTLSHGEEARPTMPDGLADIAAYLRSHGISAGADRLAIDPQKIDPADALLSYLSDASADLAVIGGAGTSGNRGWNRNSLTARVLQNMTVPMMVST